MKFLALYRTVLVVCLGYVAAFLGLRWILKWTNGSPGEFAARVAAAYFSAIVVLALAVAAKSVLERAAGGGGVLGAVRAIFTSAKPEPEPPAPPPPAAGFA